MNTHSNSAQRIKILDYLQQHGSATTIELRHQLDIMMPAARIFELKNDHNINIATTWSEDINPEGTKHRIARYVLKSGKYKGDKK